MKVIVQFLTCKRVPIEVEPTSTILSIKQIVEEREGIPVLQMRFIYKGATLDDNSKTIEEYNILDDSIIYLVLQLKENCEFTLNIQTNAEQPLIFKMKLIEKISGLKLLIQNKEGIDIKAQKLCYQGLLLEDDKKIEEYNIENNSVLKLVTDNLK